MIRLLGFLVGSAVSIGMLLLILGIPDIKLSKDVIEDIDVDAVSHTVEAAKTDIEAVANEVIDEVSEIVENLATEEPSTEQAVDNKAIEPQSPREHLSLDEPGAEGDSVVADLVAESHDDSVDTGTINDTAGDLIENDLRWHSFWNPFRSEIAANGFVTQLEKVTGLDYRVVKIKTGVYEVTFAYQSDTERRTKLSQIASATGLDLPDS